MTLTTNDVVNLLTIRSLRNVATAQARTAGTVQRQIAVILLDAAIERAVFTACEYLQISLAQNAKLDAALQQLISRGWKPPQGLESDRKRLHQQRNNVQHLGGNIDRDELPGWVITTERYVADVIRFAFTIDVDDVRYAAAITNRDIAKSLTLAENALHAGDLAAAMEAVDAAFTRTKTTWESFAVAANRELAARHSHYEPQLGRIGGDDPKMVAVQEVALLAAIAPDAGEVLWYLSARRDRAMLDADEVRRALVFVFTLAAAVEATPAATRIDRRLRDAVAQRHERSDPHQRAHLGDYRIRRLGDRTTVTFTLLDVPAPEEYAAWRTAVLEMLNTVPARVRQFEIWDDGTLSIYDVTTLDDDVDVIIAALQRAEDVVAETAAATLHAERTAAIFEAEYRQRLQEAIPASCPPWLHLSAVPGYAGEDPWAIAITLDAPPSGYWDSDTVEHAFADSNTRVVQSYHGWLLHEKQPEDVPDVLKQALPGLQAVIDAQSAEKAHREASLRVNVTTLSQRGLRRRHLDDD